MKTLKRISLLIAILFPAILLSSCSSGGSDGAGALDLTGRWDGAGTFFGQASRYSQGTMTLAQDRPTSFEGPQEVRGLMNLEGDNCVISFAFTGEVNGRTNTISVESDDAALAFVATANNREIVGNLSLFPDSESEDAPTCGASGPTRWTRIR